MIGVTATLMVLLSVACATDAQQGQASHVLEVIADPPEAAEFLLNPRADPQGRYPAGTRVTIDVLAEEGWEIDRWVGPVRDIVAESAKIDMDASQSVLVRFRRLQAAATTKEPNAITRTPPLQSIPPI